MGKKRGNKKMKLEVNNQEASTSSSSSTTNSEQHKMVKVKSGQVEKKLKSESNSKSEIDEIEDNDSSINNLPPEMLIQVLNNLDSKTLLDCRFMDRKWNGIASKILQSKCELEIKFSCADTEKGKLFIGSGREGKGLGDFIDCFTNSLSVNIPYSRFAICQVDWSMFHNRNWTKFISTFGRSIKCLKLDARSTAADNDLIKGMEKLRDLLLNQLPKLEEFGLEFGLDLCREDSENTTAIKLFPEEASKTSSSSSIVRLPNLKILHLDQSSFSKHAGIVSDLLQAAVNLKNIVPFYKFSDVNNIEVFRFLQARGKLDRLQDISMRFDYQFLAKLKLNWNCTTRLEFKPKTLKLDLTCLYLNRETALTYYNNDVVINQSDRDRASNFLSSLFESSKDTLTELKTPQLGEARPSLPKFSKVTKLCILQGYTNIGKQCKEPFLPPGIEMVDIFPVLYSLDLEILWETAFPQDLISPIPTLEIVTVSKVDISSKAIAQLSILCPNLKTFKSTRPLSKFTHTARAIWTHMKKLESLELKINVQSKANVFPAVDSAITGFVKKDVCRLHDEIMQAEQLVKKRGTQIKKSEKKWEPTRKNPSILDLKDLKQLTIELAWHAGRSEDLVSKIITPVSEDYALKLMENLTYEIKRE